MPSRDFILLMLCHEANLNRPLHYHYSNFFHTTYSKAVPKITFRDNPILERISLRTLMTTSIERSDLNAEENEMINTLMLKRRHCVL
jgi:hypothetical protein